MNMKMILGGLLRGYAILAGWTVFLALILFGVLWFSGRVTEERARAAARVLRDGLPPQAPPRVVTPQEEWKEYESARRQRDEILERRTRDLAKLEDMVQIRMAQVEADRARLDKERQEHQALASKAAELKKQAEAAKTDAELEANLPILSRMDGPSVLALTRGWEDARIVRYLRALKPSKAAEVLEAMRVDPQFEQEFRKVAPDAPKGTLTRAELIMEELKKAP